MQTYIDYTLPLEEQRAIVDNIDFSNCREDPEPIQCPNCDGKSGVAIHSRYPIAESDSMMFPFSWSSTRGVLYAKIDHPSGPIHTFCTHIAESGTAKFSYPGFEHLTGSEDENVQHIKWALEFIDTKAIPTSETILFMGDINVGPGGGERYEEDFPESFAVFTDAGYVSTVHEDGGPCTECSDNPPVDAMSTHIFLKGGPWQIQSGSSGNFLTEDMSPCGVAR